MAIQLNPSKYTAQQIEMAEPIIRAIEQYERKIAAERVCGNINEITGGSFEQAKLRKDRIATLETRKRALCDDLDNILNARNEFDKKVEEAIDMLREVHEQSRTYGFKLNEKQLEKVNDI